MRDTYNVNLEFFLDQELEKSITQQVLANDCEFDFVIGTMRTMMQNMTLSGLLSDLNTLPYLSLEDVWWCKGAADNLHIRDSLYFTAGPITPQFYFSPYAMAYNKRLAEAYQMPEIEKLVENGEWTIDKFASLLKNTAKDLDGDNKIGKDDQLGLAFDNMSASDSQSRRELRQASMTATVSGRQYELGADARHNLEAPRDIRRQGELLQRRVGRDRV